jgi:hypothetical protein
LKQFVYKKDYARGDIQNFHAQKSTDKGLSCFPSPPPLPKPHWLS